MRIPFSLCLLLLSGSVWAADPPYRFGVFPYFAGDDMQAIYQPLAERLQKALGRPVQFMTEPSHKRFIHKLNNAHYDFAVVPPFWLPVAVDRQGYHALLKMKEPFSAQLLVMEDSPYYALKDLRGKIIATPPAFTPVVNLAISSIMSQGLLPGKDIVLNENETVSECLQKLVDHLADACVSPPFAHGYYERKYKVKFRKVMSSRSIPGVTLIAHGRVSGAHRGQLEDQFLRLENSVDGRLLLQGMQTQGFIPVDIAEYAEVRKIMRESRLIH